MKISREAHARLTSSRFHAWAHALRDALRDAHAWHASNTRQSVISRVSSRKISRDAYVTDLSTMLVKNSKFKNITRMIICKKEMVVKQLNNCT